MDTAFFQVGEARGGLLVEFSSSDPTSEDGLRAELKRGGLAVGRLEEEGRFRFVPDCDPLGGRIGLLRELTAEVDDTGRTVWAAFDWADLVDLKTALRQQEALMGLVDERQLVVKTAMLERVVDD